VLEYNMVVRPAVAVQLDYAEIGNALIFEANPFSSRPTLFGELARFVLLPSSE
jgi:hypothetical protein